MKFIEQLGMILLVMVFCAGSFTLLAQTPVNRNNVENIVKQLEKNTDEFRSKLDVEFVNVSNEERRQSLFETRVAAFEFLADRFLERVEDDEVIPADVEDVLSRGLVIERELQNAKISADARAAWMRIRTNLDDLARAYDVTWVWTLNANPFWKNKAAAERVVDRLEVSADEFRRSFNYAIDSSSLNGTELEDQAVKLANDFEDQVDRWEDLADNERLSQANIELLLVRAIALESFMIANKMTLTRTWRDWSQVKANLNELAMMASIEWKWNAQPITVK